MGIICPTTIVTSPVMAHLSTATRVVDGPVKRTSGRRSTIALSVGDRVEHGPSSLVQLLVHPSDHLSGMLKLGLVIGLHEAYYNLI